MQVARAAIGPAAATEQPATGPVARPQGLGAAPTAGWPGLRPSRVLVPLAPAGGPDDCRAPAPAGLHASLEARPGTALPDSVREPAQTRFGRSFAGVRVHADADAARMAVTARAQAFTLGRHVVFGPGRYQPSTLAGAALMWHELEHLAGGPDPATMLRAPFYRYDDLAFKPPPKGLTEPQMRAQLDAKLKKTPPDITGWNIKGAAQADEAFIFLEAALFEFGVPDRWNSVSRLEMDIGWEKPVGTGAAGVIPAGLVTISIDAAGVATAELVSRAATAVSPALPAADAIAKLKTDFGVDAVPGDKAWQAGELDDVVQALGLLKVSDRGAVKGVQFMRFASLPRGHAGEFSRGGGVATGATRVTAPPTLKLADSAFPKHRFELGPAGGTPLPGSEQTILHEVGHAVEEAVARAADEKLDVAIIRENVAVKARNAALEQARQAAGSPDAQRTADEFAKRDQAYHATLGPVATARTAFAATVVPAAVITPLQTDATAKKTAYSTAKTAAVAAMRTAAAGDAADSLAYRTAVDAFATAISDYVTKAQPGADRDALDDALATAKAARDKARADLAAQNAANPALAAFAPVDAAQNDWADAARALGHTRGRTRRLQKFVDVVKAAGITPGLTKYAQESWPYKPEEFYAETFSLWISEPDFLKTNYPDLFKFFDSGDYAK